MQRLIKNKTILILALILLLAAFLRLYRIADFMTFLGDEGRDVLVVKGILEGDLTFIGPRSSAGDFYTGPVYYYMMAPFLWLFGLDPVGPSIMIAILGVATVFLLFLVCKKFFDERVGLVAAVLYAVSPLVIIYSHSSWNPNPMPFFTLLIMYLLFLAVQNKSWKYFLGIGFLYGIGLQLHYIMLFVGITIFFYTLFAFFYQTQNKLFVLFKQFLVMIGGFILGMSPFLAFEIKNNFPNSRTVFNYITQGDPATSTVAASFTQIIWDVFFRVWARLLWNYPPPFIPEQLLSTVSFSIVALAIAAIGVLLVNKNKLLVGLLISWLFFGVVLFGFYKKPINDYNFEFLFPLPFILFAYMLVRMFDSKKYLNIGKGLAVSLFIFLFSYNLYYTPIRKEPNRQMNQMRTIAEFTLSKTDPEPFNFALITSGNSDHAYRYFFSIHDRDPITIETLEKDPERKTVTDQLMVVCEDKGCGPLGYPLWEVAGFGRAEIVGEWELPWVKIFKLKHFEETTND